MLRGSIGGPAVGRRREHVALGGQPQVELDALRPAPFLMQPQFFDGSGGNRHATLLIGLGALLQPAPLAAVDRDGARVEVDVRPPQRADLAVAPAHAQRQREEERPLGIA
jgi:hypothetical protein